MFKRIFLALCLLVLCVTVSSGGITDKLKSVIARKNVAGGVSCASCNTGNDSVQFEDAGIDANSYFDMGDEGLWQAWQFTAGSDTCLTEYIVAVRDDGDTCTLTVEIYTDDTGDPGSSLGAGYLVSNADICDALCDEVFTLAATQTLSAGTYWAVMKETAGGGCDIGWDDPDTGGTYKFSQDSGSSWVDDSDYAKEFDIWGCSPS